MDTRKTAGSSQKPMPQVISFQDPLPESRHYRPEADRILSGDPAQTATNLFQSADAASILEYGKPSQENGASSSRRASSVISWPV